MKNNLEEEYVFYRFATDDLTEAYSSLKLIKRYKREIVIFALIKIAIISYSRPFKTCHGKYGRYKIKDNIIPENFKSLHQKIIKYRDQIFAHSDILEKKPSVNKLRIENKTRFSITYRGFSPKDFHHEIEKMKKLIKAILSSLNLRIDEIEQKLIN